MNVSIKNTVMSAAVFAAMTAVGSSTALGMNIGLKEIVEGGYSNIRRTPRMLKKVGERDISSIRSSTVRVDLSNAPEGIGLKGLGFSNCSNLTVVVLPQSLKKLPRFCFENCRSLASVNLDNIEEIGYQCFLGCSSLSGILLSESLTTLPNRCFQDCSSLKSIDLKSIKEIGYNCFSGCSSLSVITLSESLNKLPMGCFQDCSSLTSIDLKSIKDICYNCFSGCSSLSVILLPESLKKLPDWCFEGCSSLVSINLDNIENIGFQCFSGCFSLQNVSTRQWGFIKEYNSFVNTPFNF